MNGQKLQCQLELNTRSSITRALSTSETISAVKLTENDCHLGSRWCQRPSNSTKTSRNYSFSRENSDSNITTLDDQEFNNEGKLFVHSYDLLVKQSQFDIKRKTKSTEKLVSSVQPKCKYANIKFSSIHCITIYRIVNIGCFRFLGQIINNLCKSESVIIDQTPEDGRKMSEIRMKESHGTLTCLIEYKNTHKENYYRELNALKTLKGKYNDECDSYKDDKTKFVSLF